MKKSLAFLLSLVFVLSLMTGFSARGAVDYVNETYAYIDCKDGFGVMPEGLEKDKEYGGYVSEEGFSLGDIPWSYEYWDFADNTFKPMSGYFDECLKDDGWVHSGWSKFYTSTVESAWNDTGYTYCSVANNGKRLHPGTQAGVVLTFTAPAGGTISYDLAICLYTEKVTATATYGGDNIALFVNDTQIWPANNGIQTIYNDNASKEEPFQVSVTSFKVNAGDKVRFRVTTSNGNRGSKGTELESFPVVTYHSAEVPIGNPKGEAPVTVVTEQISKKTTDMAVSWSEAKNAVGYNLYLKGPEEGDFRKVNAEPITECQYTLTGLASKTMYELAVSTLTATSESERSEPQTFVTPQVDSAGSSTDGPSGSDSTAPSTDSAVTPSGSGASSQKGSNQTDTPAKEAGFPLWAIFVIVGVAVVAAAAVAVFLVLKKKKSNPVA